MSMPATTVILSIAGYDPSSGAGITADVKTAAALGCYAVTCVTALTVQSTQGVFRVEPVRADLVLQTLERLAEDLEIAAVRVGMLASAAVASAVADFLEAKRPRHIVVDPVIRSSSGARLIDLEGLGILRSRLLPISELITPNVDEAALLAGVDPMVGRQSWSEVAWQDALPLIRQLAEQLHDAGARAVVITGGHLPTPNDLLSYQTASGRQEEVFPGTHIDSRSTHGTGCAFATALTCMLARGNELPAAVLQAKQFVRQAIESGEQIGQGIGPVNPFGAV